MQTVDIDGVTYTKATDLAKDLGYTKDYVGQLCRGGKVRAELVGRSWYVDAKSLHTHRKSRYRSSAGTTKKAIHAHGDKKETSVRVPVHILHKYKPKVSHNYETDEADLIPTPKKESVPKAQSIPIVKEKTEKVTISSQTSSYKVEKELAPAPVFKGRLSVTGLDYDEKPTIKEFDDDVVTKKVKVTVDTKPTPIRSDTPSKVNRKTIKTTDHNTKTNARTVHIHAEEVQTGGLSIRYTSIALMTTFVLAVVTFGVLLSLENTVVATGTELYSSYKLNPQEATATLKNGLK